MDHFPGVHRMSDVWTRILLGSVRSRGSALQLSATYLEVAKRQPRFRYDSDTAGLDWTFQILPAYRRVRRMCKYRVAYE